MRLLWAHFKQMSNNLGIPVFGILFCVLWSCSGFAEIACKDVYESETGKAKAVEDSHANIHTDLFTIKEVREGLHGGKRYVIETKGGWHDFIKEFSEEGGDLIQDLRLFPTLLGKEAGRFFGYEILDDHHLVIPSATEIGNAIKTFNQSLAPNDPRRIEVGIYPTLEGIVAGKIYRHEFIQNSRLPVSLKKKHFFHDLSVHALQGFFIPNEVTLVLRKRLEVLEGFVEHLRARSSADTGRIEAFIERLIDRYSNLALFSLKLDARLSLGRVGSEIYRQSEIAQNASDRKQAYKLAQGYDSWDFAADNGSKIETIERANSTNVFNGRDEEAFAFLDSRLEAVLETFKKPWITPLSDETFAEFRKYIGELQGDLKFQATKDISETLSRLIEVSQENLLVKPGWKMRIKNFILRKKVRAPTPEEIIIQQRIEHAENLMSAFK